MIVIFTGMLTSTRYFDILETALVPFTKKIFPHRRRSQPENDPKHNINYPKDFLFDRSLNWWKIDARQKA